MRLAFGWHFPISLESGREGMIDPTTYFLAYFYPRVAVYDDYNGWDRLLFVESKEFYNDFNDYTLRVQAPANYIVWAPRARPEICATGAGPRDCPHVLPVLHGHQ